MLKYIVLTLTAVFPLTLGLEKVPKSICATNPIYCQILKNNKNIDKNYAMKLSNAIYYVAKLHDIDPKKYAAILAQESRYKLNAVNKKSMDYGLSQINRNTAKAYNFDINRLTTDLAYSVEAGAIVLADIKRMYKHKEPQWWTRYNSSNPDKRKKYALAVMRFM